jgi:hypothetical protein
MRWLGLLLGVLLGTVAAAYLSLVVEFDRVPRRR